MAFPVYSRLASIDDVRAVRSRIVRVHAAVIFPLLAGYACLAPTLIPWMLGERWAPVIAPSQFMTVSGAVTAVLTGTGALMLAIGRPGLSLLWNLGHLVFFGLVVYLVAPLGIVTVAAVVAGFYLVQGLAAHWFLLRGAAGVPMRDLFSELLGPCTACAALAACAVPLRWLLARAGAPALPTLFVAGAVGSLAYGVVMRYRFPAVWADLELLVRRLLHREAAQATRKEIRRRRRQRRRRPQRGRRRSSCLSCASPSVRSHVRGAPPAVMRLRMPTSCTTSTAAPQARGSPRPAPA